MKTLIFKTFFMLFVLFISNARAASQIEFRLVQKFMIVVSVTVNDKEKLDFLLDTGTNSTIIKPEVVQKLDLRPQDRMEMITATGKQIVPRSFLQSLAFGANSAKDVGVLIMDLPAIHKIDKEICGILGQNFLAQFNYLLDFDKRRIVFDADGELENRLRGKQVLIEIEENRILIDVNIKQNIRRFLLDSGAANIILFGSTGIEKSKTSFVKLSTNTGDGAAQNAWLDFLQIGDKTFYNLPAIIMSEKSESRTEVGLLPLCLFRSIYFNHKKGFVIFNPKISE